MRPRALLVCLLSVALWLSSSSALSLCVHDAHVGFEATWSTCCATAACCDAPETAAVADDGEHRHVGAAPDGCRDYVLGLGADWIPANDRSIDLAHAVALPIALPLTWTLPAQPPRFAPSGVPPPQRPQRSPILRC